MTDTGWKPGAPLKRGGGELTPGVEHRVEFEVEGWLVTDVGGTIGARVLSTPGMIGAMERAGAELAIMGLPEGKATVGFEVCIKHVAPAPEGATCAARAELREVDGRKLLGVSSSTVAPSTAVHHWAYSASSVPGLVPVG